VGAFKDGVIELVVLNFCRFRSNFQGDTDFLPNKVLVIFIGSATGVRANLVSLDDCLEFFGTETATSIFIKKHKEFLNRLLSAHLVHVEAEWEELVETAITVSI